MRLLKTEKCCTDICHGPRISPGETGVGPTVHPDLPPPNPWLLFSTHLVGKACHCLRAASSKAPRKPPRTPVCSGLGKEKRPGRIVRTPGPWSSISAPGQVSDSLYLSLDSPLCPMRDPFYLQKRNTIWHLTVTASSLCGCDPISHK